MNDYAEDVLDSQYEEFDDDVSFEDYEDETFEISSY